MTRGQRFNADYWRENLDLFIETIKEYDSRLSDNTLLRSLKRRNKTKKITELKDRKFEEDCRNIAMELEDECWEKFIKRARDKKYESNSNRSRLSVSKATFNKVSKLTAELGCESKTQLIELMLNTINKDQLKKSLKNR